MHIFNPAVNDVGVINATHILWHIATFKLIPGSLLPILLELGKGEAKRDPEDKVVLLSVNSDIVYLKCSAVTLKDTNQNQRLQFK